jgi:hypothetical protein
MRHCRVAAAVFLVLVAARGQDRVNADAAVLKDFDARVAAYLKLRKGVVAGVPDLKPTHSAAAIAQRERELAERIRTSRPDAKQGDIFAPPIAAQFRRLLSLAMKGGNANRVRQSLDNAEPVRTPLHVNGTHPASVPRQSTPPTLLLNLPRLPAELAYGVVGHDLLLRDIGANLIVDFIPHAIP